MKSIQQGSVYILTNPCFKNDWIKIGKSLKPIDPLFKELHNNTRVPLSFEIFATMKTTRYNEAEKLIHDRIDDIRYRPRKRRKFFNITPEKALRIFIEVAESIADAEIIRYKDNKPLL